MTLNAFLLMAAFMASAVGQDSAAEAGQSEAHKPLACPQCGTWNIHGIEGLGAKNSTSNSPVGEIMTIDETSINIPFCGKFSYKTGASNIKKEGYQQYQSLNLRVTGFVAATPAGQCKGDKWTINAEISDGPFDEGGWGSAEVILVNSAGSKLKLNAWEPERLDITAYGTPGEAAKTDFELARSLKKLTTLSDNLSPQFDVARFSKKAEKSCGNQYRDQQYNPAIGVRVNECVLKAYTAKLAELSAKAKAKTAIAGGK